MTRLLTFQFDEGRPRLNPAEEAAIRKRTLDADFQAALRNPAATLVAVGYIDDAAEGQEKRQLAFRRAQILADLLRDRCDARAAIQVLIQHVKILPADEQPGKQRVAEIWLTDL